MNSYQIRGVAAAVPVIRNVTTVHDARQNIFHVRPGHLNQKKSVSLMKQKEPPNKKPNNDQTTIKLECSELRPLPTLALSSFGARQ